MSLQSARYYLDFCDALATASEISGSIVLKFDGGESFTVYPGDLKQLANYIEDLMAKNEALERRIDIAKSNLENAMEIL